MKKPLQKRTLATRAKLIDAAEKIISSKGFGALRVEEVVKTAAVAKGTFFAHFHDKDALMDLIISGEIDAFLDGFEQKASPEDLDAFILHLLPLLQFMTRERYVFDLILRHSGAAAKEEIGPIARTFERQVMVLAQWISDGPFRKDVSTVILAEGVQAFAVQCMALHFCAINNEMPMDTRLKLYLEPWLLCPKAP
ncbi:MAG: TetR/AcrR family transcriptional regulator [Aliishimia sp.]